MREKIDAISRELENVKEYAFSRRINKVLAELSDTAYWNLLIRKINKNFPTRDNMMLRIGKEDRHNVFMVNDFFEFPKEFIEKIEKAVPSPKSGGTIDTKNRKISLVKEDWEKIYSPEELENLSNVFSDKVLDFNTLTDARDWFSNSGFADWEWFEGFDEDELIEYAYRQSDGEKTENEIVKDFLLLKKQNPRDYDL